mgnify:CR=1 FL=1
MAEENNNEIFKLKKYAQVLGVLFFITLISIALAYSTIEINNRDTLNKIQSENYNNLNSLNDTYQSLNSKKEKLLINYLEIDKLYQEISQSFNQINTNNNLTNKEILTLEQNVAYYEAENAKLQNEITNLEAELK